MTLGDRPFAIRAPWPAVAWVIALGLALGVLTQVGQSLLPSGWSQIANSISPWLLVVFLVGAALPSDRWAMAAGIAILLLALAGYYASTLVRYGIGGGGGSLAFWTIGAFAGGPVFGIAGQWWVDSRRWRRGAAIGLMSAAATAEGVYLVGILPDASVGLGFVIVGVVLPLLLGCSGRDRLAGYAAMAPSLVMAGLGYLVFLALYDLVTR